jgi:hypothetical protein
MSSLSTTRSYDDGEVLVRADLDAFLDDIETFLNVTKINDDNIQNSGITGSTKLLNSSVTAGKLAADSVTTLKIADSNVTTAKIADENVTTAKIADLNVTTAKINDLAVTTGKLAADAVTNAKLADDAVDTENIADSAIETALINDAAVTTAKINDGAVTPAKQNTYYAIGTVATDTSWILNEAKAITNVTVSGRPVRITIFTGEIEYTPTGASGSAVVRLQYSPDNAAWTTLQDVASFLFTTATNPQTATFNKLSSSEVVPANSGGAVVCVHTPAAGAAYYRLIPTTLSGGTLDIDAAISALVEEL